MPTYHCGNCDRDYDSLVNEFPDIPGLTERIAPGEPVPDGECPNCGALVHEVKRPEVFEPDPAALYCIMRSIEKSIKHIPSETYGGADEFLRCAFRAADSFERWACKHVDFDSIDEVWPYYLEAHFGSALLSVRPDIAVRCCLDSMTNAACQSVAVALNLPLRRET